MKKKRRLLQSDLFWGLGAALLVLLQFWWLPGEDGAAADSYSTTVDGKLGLFRTLNELFPVVERDAIKVAPDEPATMILIAPDRYPNEEEQQQLYEFVYNGGDLLFAPNWLSRDWTDPPGAGPSVSIPSLGIKFDYRPDTDVATASSLIVTPGPATSSNPATASADPIDGIAEKTMPDASNEASKNDASEKVPVDPTATPVAPAVPATVEEDKPHGEEITATSSLVNEAVNFLSTATLILPIHLTTEALVTSAGGEVQAATWTMGYGRVLVCSSADLFSNRSMLFKGSRRLAVRLVERCAANTESELETYEPKIVISEYFNASDSFQNTGILFSPALRIGTLQLLLVAVLGIWMAFHRFGPAIEVTNAQRRTLTESAQAVGNLQYRLSDGGVVVKGYMDYISSQLRRRYGSLLRLDQHDLIASRTGLDVQEVRDSLNEARQMADAPQVSRAKAASMLRWLAKLQQRLSGNRGSP